MEPDSISSLGAAGLEDRLCQGVTAELGWNEWPTRVKSLVTRRGDFPRIQFDVDGKPVAIVVKRPGSWALVHWRREGKTVRKVRESHFAEPHAIGWLAEVIEVALS